jgi:TPR repeat protein
MKFEILGGVLRRALHTDAFSRRALTILFSLGIALTSGAAERKSRKAGKEPEDSAPILMARTGGGDIWADVKELTAAANKGNRKAQAQLGEMMLRGNAEHKVTQDRARALTLLEEAARGGEPSAAFRIGMLLDDGEVVAQDRARALAYFRAAAAGGAGEGYHNIGAAYASGRGVKPDLAEALGWLILAGRHGASASAEQALREGLESRGRGAIIASGERRAEQIGRELATRQPVEWLPQPGPLVPLDTPKAAPGSSRP